MEVGTILAVVSAASALAGVAGSIQAGNAQQAALNRNAEVDRTNAGTAMGQAEAEAARSQEMTRRRVATATNVAGASGVDISSGSPLDVLADISAEGALDEQILRWKGRQSAAANLRQATNDTAAGEQASTAGYIQAGTTLLTAAGKTYQAVKYPSSRLF